MAQRRPAPKLELLAPAGNLQKLKTACAYGADAIYLGLPEFSLRARVNDFGLAEIKEAAAYAHGLGKKVYVTANIFAHNRHLEALPAYFKALKKLSIDAIIVSDPGVLALAKKYRPAAAIHLSTQANCTNAAAAKFWAEQGVQRIVLGREVTLAEIGAIHQACPRLELEYFVHGAMCMAYSGRCFLSKMFTDRSGNLGDCAQICRWPFEVDRFRLRTPGRSEELELVETSSGAYLLNSQDLCLIKYLPALVEAGVTSFKIEGRAKSVYYLGMVCATYRRALEMIGARVSEAAYKKEAARLFRELSAKITNRGYTAGFLLGGRGDQNVADSHEAVDWEFCGQATRQEKMAGGRRRLFFKVHNTIKAGDTVEIIGGSYELVRLKVKVLFDASSGEKLSEAHGGGGNRECYLEISSPQALPEFAVMRRYLK